PDFEMRKELAARFLEAKHYEDDISAESLARQFDGFCAAQIESVINKAALIAGQQNRECFSLGDIKAALKEI
ncbi:MAG: hypothetical protein J5505_05090, partial [Spirochaetaceae bacterium]|nr:hypothetical protein [Spirochaetaceae bacterium]